jgi:hypothetical protein
MKAMQRILVLSWYHGFSRLVDRISNCCLTETQEGAPIDTNTSEHDRATNSMDD